LGDEEGHVARLHGRFAIAELGSDVDLDGEPSEAFEPVFPDETGEISCAAGGNRQALHVAEIERQFHRKRDPAGREVHVMGERATHDLRLLVDLLRHEVAVVALLGDEGAGDDFLARTLHRTTFGIADVRAVTGEDGPVAVLQVADLVRQRRERQRVGAEIHLALAEPDRQRGAVTGPDEKVLLSREQEGEREGAPQAWEGRSHGLQGRAALAELVGDELGHDLGVGLGLEADLRLFELPLQLAKVLDDAVVDHGQPFRGVRVRVGLVGLAVGGPTGVADPDGAR
jgi:hypothetical protein